MEKRLDNLEKKDKEAQSKREEEKQVMYKQLHASVQLYNSLDNKLHYTFWLCMASITLSIISILLVLLV